MLIKESLNILQGIRAHPPEGWEFNKPLLSFKEVDSKVKESLQAFKEGHGSKQRIRSESKLQSGYYDIPYYRKAIAKLMEQVQPNAFVVDLGCGDGRMTDLLLEQNKIAAVLALDFNINDLLALWGDLSEENKIRVQPAFASVTDPPLFENKADCVVMSEVAYVLDDPRKAYERMAQWLRPGGYTMVSNVAQAAYFVHALLNSDFAQIGRVTQNLYKDYVRGQTDYPLNIHLYNKERLIKEAEDYGLIPIETITVPAGPSLLIHAFNQVDKAVSEVLELLEAVNKAAIEIPRLYIEIFKKDK